MTDNEKRILRQQSLLDDVKNALMLKNDAALAVVMAVYPPAISKLRSGVTEFSASDIIKIHELTQWSITDIKRALKLPTVREQSAIRQAEKEAAKPATVRPGAQPVKAPTIID